VTKPNASAEELFQFAVQAQSFAHSPYSQKTVGSALRLANGKIYSGCNIENSSYGGTICAERVAICKAVSENKGALVTEICVVSPVPAGARPWPPCGFCRQFLSEFATSQTQVWLANAGGVTKGMTLGELLPEAFSATDLK